MNGIQEADGSIPFSSTRNIKKAPGRLHGAFFITAGSFAAANEGMEASGWLRGNKEKYNFALRRAMGVVFTFPMNCALKVDHGIQTGAHALGYDKQGCNHCHSSDSPFWKFLGYKKSELRALQQPR